jgi:hypothetical protein
MNVYGLHARDAQFVVRSVQQQSVFQSWPLPDHAKGQIVFKFTGSSSAWMESAVLSKISVYCIVAVYAPLILLYVEAMV